MADDKTEPGDEEIEFQKTAAALRAVIKRQVQRICQKHGGHVDAATLDSLVEDLTHVCAVSLATLRKKVGSGMSLAEAHRQVDEELRQLLRLAFQNPKWREPPKPHE